MDAVQIHKDAIEFRNSPRGQFILAQALYQGIQSLYTVPEPYREVSNAMDMKYLLDTLHPGMGDLFSMMQNTIYPTGEKHD